MNLLTIRRLMRSQHAFTIAELLVSTVVILLTSVAILFGYTQCLELHAINQNALAALQNARNTMETIQSTPFDQVYDRYHRATFPLKGLDGIGTVEIDNKNPLLMGVTVRCFWRTRGHITGEDKNFNGQLDFGEDTNNNGLLDSPLSLFTNISKR